MRLTSVMTPSILFTQPAEREQTAKPGQLIQTDILASDGNQVVLRINGQLVAAKSLLPLEAGPATLQVVEADPHQVVVRVVAQGSDARPIDDLVHSLGLTLNEDRRFLARELVLRGLPVEREVLLQLEKIVRTKTGKSLNPTTLVSLVKAKLPLKETTALAVSQWERSDQGQQPYVYIDLDFTASPFHCSWHSVEPEGEHNTRNGSSSARPIVIGCLTENLGPVLVVIQDTKDSLSLRFVMMDDKRKNFIGHELSELHDQLKPLIQSIQLAVDTLSATQSHERGALRLRHFDTQI